jgi:ABC-type dipeptide/oligopeptide/nickel transport system ATPase component
MNCLISVGFRGAHKTIGFIDKLNHEMTSYDTRQSSYGDPTGCMPETRVKILEDLEAWALNADSSKVYWMIGMAGIGKSTISHTLCKILEEKNILGGNVFCSRASDKTNNPRLIIPVIAHALARASPSIAFEVIKAIKNKALLAELSYHNMDEQFEQLIYTPLRKTSSKMARTYKIVVIDAVDECVNLEVVSSLIKLILKSASDIPLKIFIASRDDYWIRKAFKSGDGVREYFYLHDIEKDVVQNDIRKYLEASLARIKDGDSEEWPSPIELSGLVQRSGTLFIYAATAVRYIAQGREFYKSRLSEMAIQGLESVTEFKTDIDFLYIHILEKACEAKRSHEVTPMRDLVSIIIFLRNPLPTNAIASLSEMNANLYLSPLTSVIHIPKQQGAVVAPFHASFPDFITNPDRCSPDRCPSFRSLVASESHELLALKCLKQMNQSLKYNICEIPKELTLPRRGRANSSENVGKISEALKYSCLYWAAHLAEVEVFDTVLVNALRVFLHKHLLHWMECLSTLGELQTGPRSLRSMVSVLSVSRLLEGRKKL